MNKQESAPQLHGRDHVLGADPIISDWTYVGDTDAPPFESPWTNPSPPKAPVRYKFLPATDSDTQQPVVHIEGSPVGGTLGSTIFTLPLTFDYDVHQPVTDNVGFYSVLTIKQNGDVQWGVT